MERVASSADDDPEAASPPPLPMTASCEGESSVSSVDPPPLPPGFTMRGPSASLPTPPPLPTTAMSPPRPPPLPSGTASRQSPSASLPPAPSLSTLEAAAVAATPRHAPSPSLPPPPPPSELPKERRTISVSGVMQAVRKDSFGRRAGKLVSKLPWNRNAASSTASHPGNVEESEVASSVDAAAVGPKRDQNPESKKRAMMSGGKEWKQRRMERLRGKGAERSGN